MTAEEILEKVLDKRSSILKTILLLSLLNDDYNNLEYDNPIYHSIKKFKKLSLNDKVKISFYYKTSSKTEIIKKDLVKNIRNFKEFERVFWSIIKKIEFYNKKEKVNDSTLIFKIKIETTNDIFIILVRYINSVLFSFQILELHFNRFYTYLINTLPLLGYISGKDGIKIKPVLEPYYNFITIFPNFNSNELYLSNFESNKLITLELIKNDKGNILINYKEILESLEHLMDYYVLSIPKLEVIKKITGTNRGISLTIDTKYSYFTPLITLKFDHLFLSYVNDLIWKNKWSIVGFLLKITTYRDNEWIKNFKKLLKRFGIEENKDYIRVNNSFYFYSFNKDLIDIQKLLSIVLPQVLNEKLNEKEDNGNIFTYLEPSSSFSLYFVLSTTGEMRKKYGDYFIPILTWNAYLSDCYREPIFIIKLEDLLNNFSSFDNKSISSLLNKFSIEKNEDFVKDLKFMIKVTNKDINKYGKVLFSLFSNIFYALYLKGLNETLKVKIKNKIYKISIESREVFQGIFNIIVKLKL